MLSPARRHLVCRLLPLFALPVALLSLDGCGLKLEDDLSDGPAGPPTTPPALFGTAGSRANSTSAGEDGGPLGQAADGEGPNVNGPVIEFSGPVADAGCSVDAECSPGFVCLARRCFESATCSGDHQCDSQACDEARATCLLATGGSVSPRPEAVRETPPNPTLVAPPSLEEASGELTGSGAGEAATCAADAGPCGEPPSTCFDNDDCEDGLCVNAACQSFCDVDEDCDALDGCVLGLCRPGAAGWECIDAGDCPRSDDCVGARCVRRCLMDGHCVQSDDGPTCELGYCGP